MTEEDLIAILKNTEWNDVEVKKAQRGVPDDAYLTVSAFANTSGGHLVFGVEQKDGTFNVVGVLDVDKVQNDFLSVLRGAQKLNVALEPQEFLLQHEGKDVLVFFIPEVRRSEKPVYLNGDIRKSYIRRGAGDEKCTKQEIERFLRDASSARYERELLPDLNCEDFFDSDSLNWYRKVFGKNNGDKYVELSDVEFLNELGLIVEGGDTLIPTRAAVILFGQDRYVRQILPRPVVDYQRIDVPFEEWTPDVRWHDRVVVEENLIKAWRSIAERFHRLSEHKFSLDAETMRRTDDPPDYISFRESFINLLIHQDFGDLHRTPVVLMYADCTIFRNPGDAFSSDMQLLETADKELRNPSIVATFRRIGLSDQAGTGIRSIFRNWNELGYMPPVLNNDKSQKLFQLTLPKIPLISEEQLLFQAALGVELSTEEASVFAFITHHGHITLFEVKSIVPKSTAQCFALVTRLVNQGIVHVDKPDSRWVLAPHLVEILAGGAQTTAKTESLVTPDSDQAGGGTESLVTKQSDQAVENRTGLVTQRLTKLTDIQRRILRFCDTPRKAEAVMAEIKVSHRTYFRNRHLKPLIDANLLQLSHPEQLTHPDQAYTITTHGLKLIKDDF